MSSIDPLEAANAANNAVGHWDIVRQNMPPIGIAAVLWTFLMVRDLAKIKTWRGRVMLYFSRLTTGVASSYATLLLIPHLSLPFIVGVAEQQIIALVGFVVGVDAVNMIARRFLGIKTREGDD